LESLSKDPIVFFEAELMPRESQVFDAIHGHQENNAQTWVSFVKKSVIWTSSAQ